VIVAVVVVEKKLKKNQMSSAQLMNFRYKIVDVVEIALVVVVVVVVVAWKTMMTS